MDWLGFRFVNHGLAGSIPATSRVSKFSTMPLDKILVLDILETVDKPESRTNLGPPKAAPKAVFWFSEILRDSIS